MKKLLKLLIIFTVIMSLISCGSLNSNDLSKVNEHINVKAQIIDFKDNSMLLIGLDDKLQGLVTVHLEKYPADVISPGNIISFDFNGQIAESYPAQINSIENIKLVEAKPNTIGVYREAILDLKSVNIGLGEKATELALDLTEVTNLSNEEKEALTYLISCDTKMIDTVYQSDIQQLKLNEKIVEDENGFMYFPTGVMYKIININEPNGNFTFNIEKWVSSLAAYGYSNCKAILKDNIYTWEKGNELIS